MAVAELLRQLLVEPSGHGKTALVVGRTHTHVRDQLVPIFEAILSNQDVRGRERGISANEYRLIRSAPMTLYLPFDCKVIFWSLEGGKSIKGLNVTHALVDEVTDMAERDFDDVFDRVGREGGPGRLWCMGNPGNKFHWFYKRFWKEYEEHGNRPENRAFCVALTYRDNPHTAHKWAEWEKLYSYSPIEKARKLDGLWINTDGMVFPGWDPDKHCFDRAKQSISLEWELYGGLDFGYKDPTAGLRVAKTKDGRFLVYSEYYEPATAEKQIPQHAAWFATSQFPGERLIEVFSDNHLDTVATYRREGLHSIHPVSKPAGSIVAGCALINQLLQAGLLLIARDCVNLIAEVETYEWNPRKDEPKKGFGDHALDALRYVLLELCKGTDVTILSPADVPLGPPVDEKRAVFAYEFDSFTGRMIPIYAN